MKQFIFITALFLFAFAAAAQPSNRVRLRQLEAAPGSGYIIQSLNDTCLWVGVSSVVKYQTLRDDGTPVTQRDAINFVATSTVATTLTDDAGNGETEVALSVPTGGITSTQILDGTILVGDINQNSASTHDGLAWNGSAWEARPDNAVLQSGDCYYMATVGGGVLPASGSNQTGAIEIKLPSATYASLNYVRIEVSVFGGANKADFIIDGRFTNTYSWGVTTSKQNGPLVNSLDVRFGSESSRPTIWIGELTTSWTTPNVVIKNIIFYSISGTIPTFAQMSEGWSIAFESTAFGTVSGTSTSFLPQGRFVTAADNVNLYVTSAPAVLAQKYNGNFTGAIEITLPNPTALSGATGYFIVRVTVWNLATVLHEFDIRFNYAFTTRVMSGQAVRAITGALPSYGFRFGDDGSVGKIWIGELTTAWTSNAVTLEYIKGTNITETQTNALFSGWSISTETSAFNNVDNTITGPSTGAIPYTSENGWNHSSTFIYDGAKLGIGNATPSGTLNVKGAGATSVTVNTLLENSAGTDLLYLDDSGQLGLLTNIPARTLHVAGETRITDLTTDTPTRIVGADADGDLNEITVSSELDLTGGVLSVGIVSHGSLSDLGSPEDDHDQYPNIFGRAGGQIIRGGVNSGDDLTLRSTTDATKGDVIIQDEGGNMILGGAATASRLRIMEPSGSGTNYTEFVTQAQAANVTYTLPINDGDASGLLETDGAGNLSWYDPAVSGRVLYVSTSGNNTTAEIGNPNKPYLTISAAYTAATDGDLIYIFPGTYSEGTTNYGGKSLNYYLHQGAIMNGPYWDPAAKRIVRINGKGSIIGTTSVLFSVKYGSVYSVDVDSIASGGTYVIRTGDGYIRMKCRVARKSTTNTSFIYPELSDLSGRTFDVDINTFLSVDGSVIAMYNTTPDDINGAVNIKYLRKVSTVTDPVYTIFEAGCTDCDIVLNIEVITTTGTNSTHGFVYLDTKTFLITNSTFRFNVGTYTGEHQFFQYINTAEEVDSTSKFLLDCKNCLYTGDYSPLWRRNQNQESYMPIVVSGNWTSIETPILRDSTGTSTWEVPMFFENANLTVRNPAYYAIHVYGFSGNGSMNFKNTVFRGQDSGVAAISCATASTFTTASTYQGNTTVDADATFNALFKLE